ncbi:spore germination protein GerPC [Oceanobacillus senegalensis]|uniref:spore germination protein GerPC n=1 Tax=Oceanobacillus senegalensis TaxID=1936063 RepID=UPI0015C47159|nr:spore germination protein GerPC [Oceanobacillus senegalensis]
MYGNNWSQYMHEIQQYIQYQDAKIKELEERIQALEAKQQDHNSTNIERIEYKFDQLKIETLSGSLHIGLTPEDIQNMDDLALGHSNQAVPVNKTTPLHQQLASELQSWFQKEGPSIIRDIAKNYNKKIDDSHEILLLQDIQKQLPERITYYNEQAKNNQSITNDEEFRNYIDEQIKEEIHHSLSQYINNWRGE